MTCDHKELRWEYQDETTSNDANKRSYYSTNVSALKDIGANCVVCVRCGDIEVYRTSHAPFNVRDWFS